MSGEKLYCVDCYVPNQEPLSEKCLGLCDGDGLVDDSEGIEAKRSIRSKINPEGTHCRACKRGLLGYPNDWWRDTLKMLRCDWCHSEFRVVQRSAIIIQNKYAGEDSP